VQLICAADYGEMPWANGRGVTHQILRFPDTDFWQWRLSLATVTDNAPFSILPGIDRVLVVARGAGMVLTIDGEDVDVLTHGVVRFSGESVVTCRLLDGPVRDLNLMSRRPTRRTVKVETIHRGEPLLLTTGSESAVCTVLNGSITVTTNAGLIPHMALAHDLDSVWLEPGDAVTVSSRREAVVAIAYDQAAPPYSSATMASDQQPD
jgi:uncharacterized protein